MNPMTAESAFAAYEAVRGRLVVVCTSLVDFKAIPIPPQLRAALTDYQARTAG